MHIGTYKHPSAPKKGDNPLLVIDGLKTYFHVESGVVRAVDGVEFALEEGKTLGIVGESGSGKSVTAYSILRLLPESIAKFEGGGIIWHGEKEPVNIVKEPIENMAQYRGKQIAMIFQEPMTSLNPVFTCGWQVSESILQHNDVTKEEAWKQATKLLDEVGISNPEERMKQYPHELSGGMKQRVMIAIALACNPKLLLCDEPTTALDVTIQKQILDLISKLQKQRGTAVLFITHDLGVVAEITDFVAVMCPGETLRKLYTGTELENHPDFERGGHIVEFGSVVDIFTNPQHPYTKGLIACKPTLETCSERLPTIDDFIRAEKEGFEIDPTDPNLNLDYPGKATSRRENMAGFGDPLIDIKGLKTWFPIKKGVFQRTVDWVKAVDDVDLIIPKGKTIGLVGESGCGKTTLGKTLLRLVEPRAGTVMYEKNNITTMSASSLREMRKTMQIIFQDPFASLNPRFSIQQILLEPMELHRLFGNKKGRIDKAVWLLERVGLKAEHLNRYPHEFSGGQRQRISIARTLAVEPSFIVCDESVSALDVSIQAGVINLLLDLQDEMGLTYLFISHDLSVVKYVSDMVAVMCSNAIMADLYDQPERDKLLKERRGGHIVEYKDADVLYRDAQHPYTRKLISAIPSSDPEKILQRFRNADPMESR